MASGTMIEFKNPCPRCGDLFYPPKTLIESEKQRAAEWEEIADRNLKLLHERDCHIEELEEEIASLKGQMEREMACTDFYADKENWSYVNQYNKTLMKMNEDIEWISPGVFLDKFAGNIARSTQARREK